jgi:hypothetical protein
VHDGGKSIQVIGGEVAQAGFHSGPGIPMTTGQLRCAPNWMICA